MPVVGAAERHHALGVRAAAEALRDQMRRVDRRPPADQAGRAGDLGALGITGPHSPAADRGPPRQRDRSQRRGPLFARLLTQTPRARGPTLAPVVAADDARGEIAPAAPLPISTHRATTAAMTQEESR